MIFLKVTNPSFPGHKHTEIRSNVEFQGIRITPNVYTTLAELDRFVDVMQRIASNDLPAT